MTDYELRSRNQGSVLGPIWLVLRPFVHVTVYITLAAFIFRGTLDESQGTFGYVLVVLPTLMIWQAIARSLEEAPSLVRDKMEIVKQVAYPIETLPLTSLVGASIGPAVGIFLWFLLALATGKLPWSVVLFPIPLVLIYLFLLGASWLCMLVGVIFKDLREIIGLLMGIGIFATPALLTETMAGPRLWGILLLNPLSHIVIVFRDVFTGTFHPTSWGLFAVMSLTTFVVGAVAIHKAKAVVNEYL